MIASDAIAAALALENKDSSVVGVPSSHQLNEESSTKADSTENSVDKTSPLPTFLFDSIAIEFSLYHFFKQLCLHLFYPLSLPLSEGENQGFSSKFAPLLLFNHILPTAALIMVVTYFLTEGSPRGNQSGAIWGPLLYYFLHRVMVALKYGCLTSSEYERFFEATGEDASRYQAQVHLISGWLFRGNDVLRYELANAAILAGLLRDNLRFYITPPSSSPDAKAQYDCWQRLIAEGQLNEASSDVFRGLVEEENGMLSMSVIDAGMLITKASSHCQAKVFRKSVYPVTAITLIHIFLGLLNVRNIKVENNVGWYLTIIFYISSTVVHAFLALILEFMVVALYDVGQQRVLLIYLKHMLRISDAKVGRRLKFFFHVPSLKAKIDKLFLSSKSAPSVDLPTVDTYEDLRVLKTQREPQEGKKPSRDRMRVSNASDATANQQKPSYLNYVSAMAVARNKSDSSPKRRQQQLSIQETLRSNDDWNKLIQSSSISSSSNDLFAYLAGNSILGLDSDLSDDMSNFNPDNVERIFFGGNRSNRNGALFQSEDDIFAVDNTYVSDDEEEDDEEDEMGSNVETEGNHSAVKKKHKTKIPATNPGNESRYNFLNYQNEFLNMDEVDMHKLIPRLNCRDPRNLVAWTHLRLMIQRFGQRYRFRLNVFVGIISAVVVLMCGILLFISVALKDSELMAKAVFLQATFSVSVVFVFLLLLTFTAAKANDELDNHRKSLSSLLLHYVQKKSELLLTEEGKEEAENVSSHLDTIADCLDIIEVNNELHPFIVVAVPGQYALTSSIISTAISFYGLLIAAYRGEYQQ